VIGNSVCTVSRTIQPRDRILALQDLTGHVIGINLGAIVRRLILFEEVVLDSHAMPELPALINALSPEGFIELLSAGPLSIRADPAGSMARRVTAGWFPAGVRRLFRTSTTRSRR
jgi:hypothetical protein